MLNGQKTTPPASVAKVQKIIDQHQQAIVATPILPYSIVTGESQDTLVKYVGSD